MTDIKWNTKHPTYSGYYLATWKFGGDGRSLRVSEFWFDGNNWWTGRQYIFLDRENLIASYEETHDVTNLVISWSEKPKPFRGASK